MRRRWPRRRARRSRLRVSVYACGSPANDDWHSGEIRPLVLAMESASDKGCSALMRCNLIYPPSDSGAGQALARQCHYIPPAQRALGPSSPDLPRTAPLITDKTSFIPLAPAPHPPCPLQTTSKSSAAPSPVEERLLCVPPSSLRPRLTHDAQKSTGRGGAGNIHASPSDNTRPQPAETYSPNRGRELSVDKDKVRAVCSPVPRRHFH